MTRLSRWALDLPGRVVHVTTVLWMVLSKPYKSRDARACVYELSLVRSRAVDVTLWNVWHFIKVVKMTTFRVAYVGPLIIVWKVRLR